MPVLFDVRLIFSKDLQQHEKYAWKALQLVLEYRLCVNAEKYEFYASLVSFLCCIFESWQIRMDSEKMEDMIKWPITTTQK